MIKTKEIHMETKEREMFDNPLDRQINPITGWRVDYENFWSLQSSTEALDRPNKVERYLNR